MVFECLALGTVDCSVPLDGAIGAYARLPGECSTTAGGIAGGRAVVTGGAATAVVMMSVVKRLERCQQRVEAVQIESDAVLFRRSNASTAALQKRRRSAERAVRVSERATKSQQSRAAGGKTRA